MILKVTFTLRSNKLNRLLTIQNTAIMASRKKSNKDNKNAKISVSDLAEQKLTISSLKSFEYSPRKTRSYVKVEYDKNEKSNIDTCTKPNFQDTTETININSKRNISKNNKKSDSTEKLQTTDKIEQTHKRKTPSRDIEETIDKCDTRDTKNLKWQPQNWRQVFKNLKTMRSSSLAPVDTMGCDKCSDENADEKTKRFHVLVALMLSSQTKDQVTFEAMNRLKSKNLTPKSIVEMDSLELEQLLNPVSFYKNKAKYLQKTAKILIENYDSDIPKTVDELIKLPGVGPKMAHLCMSSAWNTITGIGVDVHVHRISNRLGWVKKATKSPEDTRKELESWLPYEYWDEINYLMVGFGQTICTPINPKCDICSNRDICPSSNLLNSKKNKKPTKSN